MEYRNLGFVLVYFINHDITLRERILLYDRKSDSILHYDDRSYTSIGSGG